MHKHPSSAGCPPEDFSELVSGLREKMLHRMFSFIWKGYRDLLQDSPADIRWDNEPSINSHLYRRTLRFWDKRLAFELASEHGIEENRIAKKGLSPKPDFSIHPKSSRSMASLSIEAKLIRYAKDMAAEIRGKARNSGYPLSFRKASSLTFLRFLRFLRQKLGCG